MAERVERRLVAILSADVVGYSRLVTADEEGTFTVLPFENMALACIKGRSQSTRVSRKFTSAMRGSLS